MNTNNILVPFDICGLHIEISAPSAEAASILRDNLEGAIKLTPIRTIDTGFDILHHPGFKQFRQDSIVQFLYKIGQMNRVNIPLLRLRDTILTKLTNYGFSMGLVVAYRSTERFDLCHVKIPFGDYQGLLASSNEITNVKTMHLPQESKYSKEAVSVHPARVA